MFSKHELKKHFLGIFEISIFMRAGVTRFQPDFSMMLKSFFWPLVILPVAVLTAAYMSPGAPFGLLLVLHVLRLVITYALSIALIAFLATKIDRTKYIYQYITTSNWFEIVMFVLISPILIFMTMGGVMEDIQYYAIFITCLGIVYTGFIVTHALRIPWELATLVAVSLLFVQETGFDVVEFITQNLPMV